MIIEDNDIKLRSLIDSEEEYKRIYKWCQEKDVYEWFEQRILSYDEIVAKYKNKLYNTNQELLIIEYNNKPIGLLQFYKYDGEIYSFINNYKKIYTFDLFIGEKDLYSKGLGNRIMNIITNYLFKNCDLILLTPCKRNIRCVKCCMKSGYKIVHEYKGKDTIGNDEEYYVMIRSKNEDN